MFNNWTEETSPCLGITAKLLIHAGKIMREQDCTAIIQRMCKRHIPMNPMQSKNCKGKG